MIYLVDLKASLKTIMLMKKVKKQQTNKLVIVEPINEFADKSPLLAARQINDKVENVIWVRVLNAS